MRGKRRLLVWVLLVFACVAVIGQTRFRTDMGAFLPRTAPMAEQVLTRQVNSGAASHLLLLGVAGAPTPVLAAVSEAMARQLRTQPAFIAVMNGDEASFADARNFVWRNRYLLSADQNFTVAGLHGALARDFGLLGTDLGPLIQQSLPSDPTGAMLVLLRQFGDTKGPPSSDGVWVSQDGSRVLLLVTTRAPGFDIGAQQQALTVIGGAFGAARGAVPGAGAVLLEESGPGVFAVHTRDVTKRDVTRLSIFAGLGAIGMLAFAYRSPLVLGLGMLPVISGALAAIAAVSLAFGFVHGVTLGFGVTLIGESIDYAIYLFTQTAPGDTAERTLARIWPTLRLGVATSVVGFSAMLFSNFTGFAQLGWFSIVGLIAASCVTRFILPRLLPPGFSASGAGALGGPLGVVIRHRRRLRVLVGVAALASVVALLAHRGGLWDRSLADLSPIPPADQALDRTLRDNLGVPDQRYFVVFPADGQQQALQRSEAFAAVLDRLAAQRQIGGYDLPATVLPSDATQAARRAALPDGPSLRARFAQARVGLPFRADVFAPFFDDVEAARTAPLLTAASLPPALALRLGSMLLQNVGGWEVIAPLRDVVDPAGVAAAISQAGPPGAAFVDLNRQSDELLKNFQHEATLLAVFGSGAILALLCLGLRSPARVLSVAAPLAAAVLMTAALLTAGGAKISIFEVVGFLLIAAVGSNYCLFFESAEPDAAARQRAVASIALANFCTVAAYGAMSFSSIPVLHDIGRTVAIGTFLSLCFGAVLGGRDVAIA